MASRVQMTLVHLALVSSRRFASVTVREAGGASTTSGRNFRAAPSSGSREARGDDGEERIGTRTSPAFQTQLARRTSTRDAGRHGVDGGEQEKTALLRLAGRASTAQTTTPRISSRRCAASCACRRGRGRRGVESPGRGFDDALAGRVADVVG